MPQLSLPGVPLNESKGWWARGKGIAIVSQAIETVHFPRGKTCGEGLHGERSDSFRPSLVRPGQVTWRCA